MIFLLLLPSPFQESPQESPQELSSFAPRSPSCLCLCQTVYCSFRGCLSCGNFIVFDCDRQLPMQVGEHISESNNFNETTFPGAAHLTRTATLQSPPIQYCILYTSTVYML